ncbi:MAG: hypothetical protein L0H93_23545, partial [Nocardioides sp.]|nr:hypothetical protein [Nocardioides sp.]
MLIDAGREKRLLELDVETGDAWGSEVIQDFDLPADAPASVTSMLDQMSSQVGLLTPAMPDEEVGVGTQGKSEGTAEFNGVEIETTATYDLESLDGDDYVTVVDVDQRYVPGEINGIE